MCTVIDLDAPCDSDRQDLERIHAHLADAAAHPGSRENLIAIIEISRDEIGKLLDGK